MKDSLIFIPDISGFTEFTTSTEINHGSHIIADLFEILVEKNKLGLTLVEIEGDALLFIKKGAVLSEKTIYDLSEEMYKAFHQHLLTFDKNRVCSCGACVKAPGLTLKFFVHKAELVELKVGKLVKYHGTGMILIHKLMKNDVPSDDYILFTEEFNSNKLDEVIISESGTNLDIIGHVNYFYSDLKKLQSGLVPKEYNFKEISNPYHSEPVTSIINAEMAHLSRDLGDLSMKEIISGNQVKVSRTNQTMNYIGNEHVCTIDGLQLRIVTSGFEKNGQKIVMLENIENVPLFKRLQKKITLEGLPDKHTRIIISFTYSKKDNLLTKILKQKPPLFVLKKMAEREIKMLHAYYDSQE